MEQKFLEKSLSAKSYKVLFLRNDDLYKSIFIYLVTFGRDISSTCIYTRASLRTINYYSIESILRNEMLQHLHVIYRTFAKLHPRRALKKRKIELTTALSTLSLRQMWPCVPRNYLSRLITDLSPRPLDSS